MERRACVRYGVDLRVELVPFNESALPAKVMDISEAGLRLRLHRHLASNTHVGFEVDGQFLTGMVRYCCLHRPTGDFVAGIQFDHKLESIESIVRRHGGHLQHEEAFA